MKQRNFISGLIQLLYYKCYKINFKRGRSCIEITERKKNKKAVINQTAVLNFVEIKKNPQTVSNIKAFINKYNCYRIKYP